MIVTLTDGWGDGWVDDLLFWFEIPLRRWSRASVRFATGWEDSYLRYERKWGFGALTKEGVGPLLGSTWKSLSFT